MPIEYRKKSFYFKVSEKTLLLVHICVCPEIKKAKKTEKYRWFSERNLLILMHKLQDVSLARVLCANMIGPKDISEVLEGLEFSFHVKCIFKKTGAKQFLLTQKTDIVDISGTSGEKLSYSGGGHIQMHFFPEKLIVFVSLEPIQFGAAGSKYINNMSYGDAKVAEQMVKPRKEKSKYFNKDRDPKITLSAVKKQTNLRSIVNKMKQLGDEKDLLVNPKNKYQKSETNLEVEESSAEKVSCKQDLTSCENYSRKRLHQEVDNSEETGLECQLSEINEHDEDFVAKKPLSRKKRQKCINYETKKDSETKENWKQRNNQCLDEDLSSTDITSSMHKNTKNVLKKTSSIDLSEETSIQNHEQVHKECVEQVDVNLLSKPEVVDVEEADKNKSKHETITITELAVPSFKNVREVADLTTEHIEFLVQKLTKKLKKIFKGKEYCRRHEDFKKGGRSKGDLAFQVRFGLYSEDQHDTIMTELMSIFCARHNKYIDYLSKVLLPETFVLIYMEVFGGNHDEVERLLMSNKRQIESQTDGSSTE